MTQQTERDDALIEKKRLADILEAIMRLGTVGPWNADLARAAALLRGDEPAKPDRCLQAWDEAFEAWDHTDRNGEESDQAAAAVLRRHFEPPSEVVEAARMVKAHYSGGAYPHSITLADFILKGDQ